MASGVYPKPFGLGFKSPHKQKGEDTCIDFTIARLTFVDHAIYRKKSTIYGDISREIKSSNHGQKMLCCFGCESYKSSNLGHILMFHYNGFYKPNTPFNMRKNPLKSSNYKDPKESNYTMLIYY